MRAGAGQGDALPHVGDGELVDRVPVIDAAATVGCGGVVRIGDPAGAGGAFLGTQAHDVEQTYRSPDDPAAVAQFGDELGHHGADGAAFVVAGAPARAASGHMPRWATRSKMVSV